MICRADCFSCAAVLFVGQPGACVAVSHSTIVSPPPQALSCLCRLTCSVLVKCSQNVMFFRASCLSGDTRRRFPFFFCSCRVHRSIDRQRDACRSCDTHTYVCVFVFFLSLIVCASIDLQTARDYGLIGPITQPAQLSWSFSLFRFDLVYWSALPALLPVWIGDKRVLYTTLVHMGSGPSNPGIGVRLLRIHSSDRPQARVSNDDWLKERPDKPHTFFCTSYRTLLAVGLSQADKNVAVDADNNRSRLSELPPLPLSLCSTLRAPRRSCSKKA